ncbi:unnamed protein product [Brachionus calyciflorus]|uniref:EGF-like domain-containing protein n=1 Tax=Brachionus calyciflorus TaxID=104777 RepID=A0A813M2S3_9BILA|nr:unnamed protein product [Brachionus calyciflorus]
MNLFILKLLLLSIFFSKSSQNLENLCETEKPCGNEPCAWIPEWSSFICNCNNGYLQLNTTCESQKCIFDSCLNGGSCTMIDKKAVCICPEGFTGLKCEKMLATTDVCQYAQNTCFNGGKCMNVHYNYMCSCESGFTGPRCEILMLCDPKICTNGVCVESDGILKCECNPGWSGPFCNNSKTGGCEANLNACKNGGTCTDLNDGLGFYCQCPQGYEGLFCDYKTSPACSEINCNYGLCFDDLSGAFCRCFQGWSGERCDKQLNCDENKCLNGGTCINGMCKCPQYFSGEHCEKISAPLCAINICSNGGTCYELSDRLFCSCLGKYYGEYCENI